MAEYAAAALSLTPVGGGWRDAISRICMYLYAEHSSDSPLPKRGRLLTVNAHKRQITRALPMDLAGINPEPEPDGIEYWTSVTVTALFASRSEYINVYARQSGSVTQVELWFPTSVHEGVFSFDIGEHSFDPQAKSDLMRLLLGVARTLEAEGLGFRFAKEDSLFGPCDLEELKDYVETGNRWLNHKLKLIVAGVAATQLAESRFEYDLDDKPMHYRRQGYYMFDILWPRDDS